MSSVPGMDELSQAVLLKRKLITEKIAELYGRYSEIIVNENPTYEEKTDCELLAVITEIAMLHSALEELSVSEAVRQVDFLRAMRCPERLIEASTKKARLSAESFTSDLMSRVNELVVDGFRSAGVPELADDLYVEDEIARMKDKLNVN